MTEQKTLLEKLAQVAPSISIETIWSHDDEPFEGDWTKGEDQDDWQCWRSEVKASAIVGGKLICESEHLGGTWEKYASHPAKSNPDISGYFPQMACEAICNLGKLSESEKIQSEALLAVALLKTEMRQRYDGQTANA